MESALIWAVTSLFILALAVGFGARMPATSPHGLFMATLTVAMVGHLVNIHYLNQAYQYEAYLVIVDLVAVGFVSVALNLLAKPASALISWPPWNNSEGFRNAVAGTSNSGITYTHLNRGLKSFFWTAIGTLVCLLVWHGLVNKSVEGAELQKKDLIFYSIGWGVYLSLAILGLVFTRGKVESKSGWHRVYRRTWWLGLVSLLAASTFLTLVGFRGTGY